MILLGYILWLVLAVGIAKLVMRNIDRGRKAKLAIGWSVGILVALLPYWDVVFALPVTLDACRNRASLHVYEDVSLPLSSVIVLSEISAYQSCPECSDILGRGLAKEVQTVIEPQPPPYGGIKPSSLVSMSGPARFWISRRGDPRCEAFFSHLAPNERDRRGYWKRKNVEYDDNACIAAESIPKLVADYRVTIRRFVEQRGVATLQVNDATFIRERDGVRLASLGHVLQLPWSQRMFHESLGAPNCPRQKQLSDGTYSQDIRASTLLRRLAARSKPKVVNP